MKTVILTLVALITGVAVGLAGTWMEFRGMQIKFEPDNGQGNSTLDDIVQKNLDKGSSTKGARVEVVDGERFDFGQIERGGSMTHNFTFKNVGTAPLRIEQGTTSCEACTIANVSKHELQPGETATVSLKWTAQQMEPDFHKEAYIPTTDPNRRIVRLIIEGKVIRTLNVSPPDVQLKNIVAGEEISGQCVLWNTRDVPISVTHELLNQENSQYFTVECVPLTAEQVAVSRSAKSGYLITVAVKPGLPLGPFSQTIRLRTDLPDSPSMDVPVNGRVLGDISVLRAKHFDDVAGILFFDEVRQAKGAKATIHVRVKGPHRHDVQLKIAKVEPDDVLKVEIGEPKEPNGGAVVMFPVTVEIPAGTRTISRLGGADDGFGRIMLETTHPVSKELPLKVKFVVVN